MKYLVILADGMADYPIESLGGKTPMEAANKPMMDKLASTALVGTVSNVPQGMVPESDTANLAVLSYDPKIYSKGRSPLEAISMGLEMTPSQTAIRCNLVTLSEKGEQDYAQKVMVDHSADEITTAEADELIRAIDQALGNAQRKFYTGVSYRHCLLWENAPNFENFMRPHDIIGKSIGAYLPSGENSEEYAALMRASYEVLKDHPVNRARRERGLNPANSIWLWSPGKKPALPSFSEKWGLKAAVISAVDLIKGIGICAGMTSIDVPGATGNIHTNFAGKASAAIDAFANGYDFVYIHIEAPDESGHRNELDNKILSIEKIDGEILRPVYDALCKTGEPFRVMVLPDHPTPLCLRTHSMEPVPFLIYDPARPQTGVTCFSEKSAAEKHFYLPRGEMLMDHFILKTADTSSQQLC